MSFSDNLEAALLNHVLRGDVAGTAFAQPTAIYMSLHSADPGETGASELTGGGYARQLATFGAPVGNESATTNEQRYTNLPAGNIGWVGLWTASTAGTPLYFGALAVARTAVAGDNITFNAGSVVVSHE